MTRWAPFLWLTGIVLVALLALARLSSAAVREPEPDGSRRPHPDRLGEPRVEVPSEAHSSDPARAETPVSDEETAGRSASATGDAPTHQAPDPLSALQESTPTGSTAPTDSGPDRVELSSGMLLANVAFTQGLIGIVLVAGILWFEIPGWALGLGADPWITGLPAIGLGVAFGIALWVGNELAAGLADAVGATYDEALRGMLAPETLRGWTTLLVIVLPTVAVVEELLFRAALIGVPAAALPLSPVVLAVGSSIAFALGHGAQGRVGIVVTGVLGLVLAVGYVVSGSLIVVIVAHYVINTTEFVVHEGLGLDRL